MPDSCWGSHNQADFTVIPGPPAHIYKLRTELKAFEDAKTACRDDGLELASIKTAVAYQYITDSNLHLCFNPAIFMALPTIWVA